MKSKSIFVVLGVVFLGFSVPFLKDVKEKTYCGRVKYLIDHSNITKTSLIGDPIMVVVFDANGDDPAFTKEIHPTWDTFLSTEQGQRICFNMIHPDRESTGMFGVILMIIGFICLALFISLKS